MAQNESPYGLRPVMHIGGAPYNGACNAYYATDNVTAIYLGDPVLLTGESYLVEHAGNPPGALPIVKQATAGQGNQISGVVVGVEALNQTSNTYRGAAEARIVWVADDPDLLFQCQAKGTIGDEAVGGGYNLTATAGAQSTVYGTSGYAINSTTATGGTGAQLIVHRAAPEPDNDITAGYSDWLVRINLHTSRVSVPSVGDIE